MPPSSFDDYVPYGASSDVVPIGKSCYKTFGSSSLCHLNVYVLHLLFCEFAIPTLSTFDRLTKIICHGYAPYIPRRIGSFVSVSGHYVFARCISSQLKPVRAKVGLPPFCPFLISKVEIYPAHPGTMFVPKPCCSFLATYKRIFVFAPGTLLGLHTYYPACLILINTLA